MFLQNPYDLIDPPQGAAPATAPPLQQVVAPQPKDPTPQTPEQRNNTVINTQHIQAELGSIPLQQTQTRVQTHNAQIDAESQLRQEFTKRPEVQNYQTVLPQYTSAIRAADNKAGDLSLIIAYNKILDPNSVVREGEVANASDVGSLTDQAQGYFHSLVGQGRLTADQRNQILGEIRTRASQAADAYNLSRSAFEKDARSYGFDPNHVIGPHPGLPFQQVEADYLGRPVHNLDGSLGPAPLKHWDLGLQAAGLQPSQADTPPNTVTHVGEGTNVWVKVPTPPGGTDHLDNQYVTYDDKKGMVEVPDGYQFGGWTKYHDDVTKRDYTIPSWKRIPPPDISDARTGKGLFEPIDAAMRGAADIPTFGFADEISALGDSLTNPSSSYRDNLRRERAIDQYDMANHAIPRFGGQVAGGFLLPIGETSTAAQLMGKGAAVGAGYGFGSTDGGLTDRLKGAAEQGAAGGLLSGAIRGGTALVKPAGKAVRGLLGIASKENQLPPLVDPATGSLNQPLQDATPAQRVAAAQQFGIDLPLDAATDRGGAIIGKGLDISPISAGIMNDSRRATEGQMKQAATNVADQYGQTSSLYAGGQAAQQGAKNWINRFNTVTGKLYDAIPIQGTDQAQTGNTSAALQRLTTIFQSNPELAATFRNSKLDTYLNAIAGKVQNVPTGLLDAAGNAVTRQEQRGGSLSWQDLKDFRSRIGYEIGEQRFSDSPSKDQLMALYGALSQDMQATAAAKGPRALATFQRANTTYQQGQDRIENALTAILGDNSRNNPEAAAATIQAIAKSGKGSANINQLTQIRNSLIKGPEWGEVSSSLLRLMGQPANSAGRDFNPQVFVRNYADMSEPARGLLFGDGQKSELRKALDQFVAVNQRLSGTDALRNTSQTATNRMGAGSVATIAGTTATLVTHPAAGLMMMGGEGATAAANYALAKAWTNPNFVRWATGYTGLVANKASGPAVQAQIGKLRQIAATNPELRDYLDPLSQTLLQQFGVPPPNQPQR